MKKSVSKIFLTLFAVTLLLAFSCCKKDETNPGSGSGGDAPFVPEAVDLGLSVCWASCNLGATTPEAYGDYYAWAEIVPNKENFSWATYKWKGEAEYTYSKYIGHGKKSLEAGDDAAAVSLKGSWRIPTQAEFEDLLNSSKVEMTWIAEKKCMKFTSKIAGFEGKFILLPAAGALVKAYDQDKGTNGNYWTSELAANCQTVVSIGFDETNWNICEDDVPYYGYTIRAVCPKN